MNKDCWFLSGAISVLFILTIVFVYLNDTPKEDLLEQQNNEYKEEIKVLKNNLDSYTNKILELSKQNAALNVAQPGGAVVTELKQALAVKESELGRMYNTLVADQERLRERESKIDKLSQEKGEKNQLQNQVSILQNEIHTWKISFFVVLAVLILIIASFILTIMWKIIKTENFAKVEKPVYEAKIVEPVRQKKIRNQPAS